MENFFWKKYGLLQAKYKENRVKPRSPKSLEAMKVK